LICRINLHLFENADIHGAGELNETGSIDYTLAGTLGLDTEYPRHLEELTISMLNVSFVLIRKHRKINNPAASWQDI